MYNKHLWSVSDVFNYMYLYLNFKMPWLLREPVIFSSPEHEVLMVSYCDQSMSVVRRASSVVNNLF